jgi:4-aminobutyrate aminotransferase-like enzyme
MDSDLSHRPEELPGLLAAARAHDLTIGSRYMAGGSVTNWSASLVALSRAGNRYARLMLGLPVHDATSGFRVYRRRLLAGADAGEALADAYVAEVDRAIASFAEIGVGFAGMLLCPVFANEGLPDVPPGFMRKAVARVRAAGGLFIADEVQAGFGRTGHMWGHELAGVVPDIVTMGKPMGNGHPLAAVVARADLVNEFRDRVMYFNTFGGNPVSCAVGNAVLEVLDREHLIDNAREVGAYVRAGLVRLQQRHTMIGDIRGHGLWIGVELVRDRVTKEPATEESHRVINLMKERGVLMGRIGQFDNVLKMRPPLPFSRANADLLLATLDDVLGLL